MNKRTAKAKKESLLVRYGMDFGSFLALVKILLNDQFKLDFSSRKKEGILKIVSSIVIFGVLTGISYLFFKLTILLNIFSIFPFVPLSVPSLIVNIVIIVGFIPMVFGIIKTLYFSIDNKVLDACPLNPMTILSSRLVFVFIKQFLLSLLVEVPFLLGYAICSSFPAASYFLLIGVDALVTFCLVWVGTFISVPFYFIACFFKKRRVLTYITYLVAFICVFLAFMYLFSLIPDSIDIFTNWGPYFSKIQSFLTDYINYCPFFYSLTELYLGSFNGASVSFLSKGAKEVLYLILLVTLIAMFLSVVLITPLYRRMVGHIPQAKANRIRPDKKTYSHHPFFAQLKKEALLLGDNPSSFLVPFMTPILFLPVPVLLLTKVFKAMNTDTLGDILVLIVSFLIIMLSLLNSATACASLYSKEGQAFNLNRSLPYSPRIVFISKLVIPSLLMIVSALASVLILLIRSQMSVISAVLLSIGVVLFSLGHLLFAGGLDIYSKEDAFSLEEQTKHNENTVTFMAFVLSFLMAFLYFRFLREDSAYIPELKVFVFGLIYYVINLHFFNKKADVYYKEGL